MLRGIWGKKIGMTQVFSEDNKVVPVTAIDFGNWFISQIKTAEQDGYAAVQVALIRNRFKNQEFSQEWLKKPRVYFEIVKEVKLSDEPAEDLKVGQSVDAATILQTGQQVNVFGLTKGRGFQGSVKRHGFSGGPASHGPRFGRWPGSISFMRSQGKVPKGKKLPGQMGGERRVMRNLEVVKIEENANIALVKGSVPGNSGSIVFMQKA